MSSYLIYMAADMTAHRLRRYGSTRPHPSIRTQPVIQAASCSRSPSEWRARLSRSRSRRRHRRTAPVPRGRRRSARWSTPPRDPDPDHAGSDPSFEAASTSLIDCGVMNERLASCALEGRCGPQHRERRVLQGGQPVLRGYRRRDGGAAPGRAADHVAHRGSVGPPRSAQRHATYQEAGYLSTNRRLVARSPLP